MEKIELPVNQVSKAECVKVIVRCRPLNDAEKAGNHRSIVKIDPKSFQVDVYKHGVTASNQKVVDVKKFIFDGVFDENFSQNQIYDSCFNQLVHSVLNGINGTIFAYGQTGTGKTYTLTGDIKLSEGHGVLPNAFKHIFQHIKDASHKRFLVRASYLEIYQETIRDLLLGDKEQGTERCEIREGPSGMYVKDLTSYFCSSYEEIMELMLKGNKIRSVGRTNMNEHSSRSHAIFQVTVEVSETWLDGQEHVKVGKLNLVDLAGSEKQGKTGATGQRFKEATKINLSLTALGNVISALVENSSHIPYRDSKLTRLLQDSLGGNSRTIMVATIGPSERNCDETLNTLRYAGRAKDIKNQPHVNEDPKDAILRNYQEEIERLKNLLELKRYNVVKESRSSDFGEDTNSASSSSVNVGKEEDDEKKANQPKESKKFDHLSHLLKPYGIDSNGNFEDIVKQLEDRKDALQKDTKTVQEKKDKCLTRLQTVTSQVKIAEQECSQLVKRISWLQSKVLNRDKCLIEHYRAQEKRIEFQEQEIKEQEERHAKLKKSLEEKQLSTNEIKDALNELRTNISSKQSKLEKLMEKISRTSEKKDDEDEEHKCQKIEMNNYCEELRRELKLKKLIIDNFIPPGFRKSVENKIRYDSKDEYYLHNDTNQEIVRPAVNRKLNHPLYNLANPDHAQHFSNEIFARDENILLLGPEPPTIRSKRFVPEKTDPSLDSAIRSAFKNLQQPCVINCSPKSSKQCAKYMSTQMNHQFIGVGPSLLLRQIPGKEKYQDYAVVPPELTLAGNSRIFLIPIPSKGVLGNKKLSKEELYALPICYSSRDTFVTNKQRETAKYHLSLN